MARKKATIADFSKLWERHEALYRGVFIAALNELSVTEEQCKHEDDISEALCPVLRNICFLDKNNPLLPQWERPIAPVSGDALKGGKNATRPDFTCSLVDVFAVTPEMHEIPLHIECKRLGVKKGSWDLNKNYVEHGVKRFDSLVHEYGKSAPSGIMVGYIIDGDKDDILIVVNRYLLGMGFSRITFLLTTRVKSCDTIICRKTIEPKDFKLIHIWADLRNAKTNER